MHKVLEGYTTENRILNDNKSSCKQGLHCSLTTFLVQPALLQQCFVWRKRELFRLACRKLLDSQLTSANCLLENDMCPTILPFPKKRNPPQHTAGKLSRQVTSPTKDLISHTSVRDMYRVLLQRKNLQTIEIKHQRSAKKEASNNSVCATDRSKIEEVD